MARWTRLRTHGSSVAVEGAKEDTESGTDSEY
jgi:hypothetical protein